MRARALLCTLLLLSAAASRVHSDALPRKAALGVGLGAVAPEDRERWRLPEDRGALITQVMPGLSAAAAGLRTGDIVLALDGAPVTTPTLVQRLAGLRAGAKVTLDVLRAGRRITPRVTLLEKPRDPGSSDYAVEYLHVATAAGRMRTIVTRPRTPGRYPALFFVQGYAPVSYDFPLAGGPGLAPLLHAFAAGGFVTLRVDKPGIGDSEGGPFNEVDFTTELDIYRQALAQLKARPDVDTSRIILLGHSMGGAFGPMVAAENPVRGLVMYGIVGRTWHEYLLDTTRRQHLLAGVSHAETDEVVRHTARLLHHVFVEGLTTEQVVQRHPELAGVTEGTMPGGRFQGKTPAFWSQLLATNFASYWERCAGRVLSVHGGSDYVSEWQDHQTLADIVNRVRPGTATALEVPGCDHGFNAWPTEADSHRNHSQGTFNPAIIPVIRDWVAQVLGG